MTEPETRRRRRPAVSCTLCRKRKIRCNREFPCSNCMRSKSGTCNYESYPPLGHRKSLTEVASGTQDGQQEERGDGEAESEPEPLLSGRFLVSSHEETSSPANLPAASKKAAASLAGESSAGASTLVGHPSPQDLQNKIKQLEEQLAALKQLGPQTPVREPQLLLDSAVGGILHTLSGDVIVRASQLFGQVKTTSHGIVHKRRLFGQTHWMSSILLLREIIEMLDPHLYTGELKAADMIQKCKVLARIIKKDRTPLWPAIPTTDLPPKEVADELVDNYMRTVEIQYRILHIPTFRKMYEAVWVSGAERDKDFMVQLNLVLAIGATTYDDAFSMRTSAIRWVYEAQTWRSEPHMKHRLKLQTLQTEILQILAQEMVGVDGSLTWIGIGSLLRTALYMGLHRDAARLLKRGVLNAEMRRRIFNTILELVLGTSMTSGGAPLISLEDFDTEPPANFDDEQLLEDDPIPKPSDVLTDTSAAIALRKSLPLRLRILKYLNNTGSQNSYEESLKLDAELREAYKTLRKAVRPSASTENGRCTVRVLDLLMNRYLMALHFPYYNLALQSSAFAYTRTALIDASVKAWRAVFPDTSRASFGGPDAASSAAALEADTGRSVDLLRRLAVCASGSYRTVFHQCAIAVAAELAAQVREGESLGPVTLRPDLLDLLACARDFFFRGVEAGDTSVKGYMVMCIASEPVRCYLDGRGREELPQRILRAAEESIARCLPLLEERVAAIKARPAGGGAGVGPDGMVDPLAMETPGGTMDNWNFMMPGMEIDPEMNSDPMNWLFADIGTAGSIVW